MTTEPEDAMATKKVMLACVAGVSINLLVAKMQEAAENKGLDYEIFAVPTAKVLEKADDQSIDCVLLGPQVWYMESECKESFGSRGVSVGVIPMLDYGLMNGANVLTFAQSLMEK